MKGKNILLVASSMALGSLALAAEHPDLDLIIIDHADHLQKDQLPSIEKLSMELAIATQSAMYFEYKECKVEGDEWDSVTIKYADAVLPGYISPVMPVSHAPPKA